MSSTVFAGLSAKRKSGESYFIAHMRNLTLNINPPMGPFQPLQQDEPFIAPATNVVRMKKTLKNIDVKEIPDLGSYADLENQFKILRDERFIQKDPNFPRRSTWMYPDDGCYARAELMKNRLADNHMPAPKKIFVFGDLWAHTSNHRSGMVSWWYHVAVTYRVGNEAYVLDPSLDPKRPMKLAEWNKAVGGHDTKVEYSICEADAIDPESDCKTPHRTSAEEAMDLQEPFLELEWDRLIELKRDPNAELGEFPPWLLAN